MPRQNTYNRNLTLALSGNALEREREIQAAEAVKTGNAQKNKVIEAIKDSKLRVTAADVATNTGLTLSECTRQLNQIACDTAGTLQVSDGGIIAYKFNPGFQSAYLAHGIKLALQQAWDLACRVGFFLLKISFGVILVISMIIIAIVIVLFIIAMIAAASSGSSDSDSSSSSSSDSGGSGLGGLFDGNTFNSIFIWDTTPSTYTYSYDKPATKKGNGFLADCFSFLFGDGNPNAHLEERKWQYVASVIQHNNGVATAEQLAPYTGVDPKSEDGMLAVLVRFNGAPEVTDSGNIVYRFPDLRSTAGNMNLLKDPPHSLHEFLMDFTSAEGGSMVGVVILAAINCIGSWWLWLNLAYVQHTIAVLNIPAELLASLNWLSPVLLVYGTAFVLIPFVRAIANWVINARIESRNERKDTFAKILNHPSAELKTKLAEARAYAIAQTNVDENNLAYTSDKDLLEQTFEKEETKSRRNATQGTLPIVSARRKRYRQYSR